MVDDKNVSEAGLFELDTDEIEDVKSRISRTRLERFTLRQLFGKDWLELGPARNYGLRFIESFRKGVFPEIVEGGKKSNSVVYSKLK